MNRLNETRLLPARDPRWYQIAALAALLAYGLFWLRFDVTVSAAAIILSVALLAQFSFTGLCKLPEFDPRSALISALSLCLLLRSDSLWLAAVAAVVAIASKFALRWNGKHLFNPTNFALVALLLCADGRVWVSPGQWGSGAFFGFLMACVGGLVVTRAARSDVTLAFLAAYVALLFGRSLWLGEPMSIPLHRLQNGALLLFAFFMISDPKTTPDSRAGRVVFAALVALGAAFVQFKLFRTNGLLWSLAACSFLVPALDWLLPGKRYTWRREVISNPTETSKVPNYEPIPGNPAGGAVRAGAG
ncbi:MAG TPA: RnfABCDGE type electron transport complex subunit D [Verrucomicrobiae bacterium]|nr:RnfABCDGE type electron transport complex subunit D [Verrucomicrobiae bacterium]